MLSSLSCEGGCLGTGGQAGRKDTQATGQSSVRINPLASGNFTDIPGVSGVLDAQPPS